MERLGKIPAIGDSFTYAGYTVTVTKTAARHAVQIVLQSQHSLTGEN